MGHEESNPLARSPNPRTKQRLFALGRCHDTRWLWFGYHRTAEVATQSASSGMGGRLRAYSSEDEHSAPMRCASLLQPSTSIPRVAARQCHRHGGEGAIQRWLIKQCSEDALQARSRVYAREYAHLSRHAHLSPVQQGALHKAILRTEVRLGRDNRGAA